MKKFILAAVAAVSVVGFSFAASAMPAANGSIPGSALSPNVVLTAGGCGPGFHRGPRGGCRPNRGFGAPRVYAPRCELRRGPYGRVFRVCR